MKKTILSILVVLLLSFVLAGCVDEEPADPADLSAEAIKAVEGYGWDSDDIPVPADTTFHGHYLHSVAGLFLVWKDADLAKYDAYKASFAARAAFTRDDIVDIKGESGTIFFYPVASTDDGIDVPANSIVLNIKRRS